MTMAQLTLLARVEKEVNERSAKQSGQAPNVKKVSRLEDSTDLMRSMNR